MLLLMPWVPSHHRRHGLTKRRGHLHDARPPMARACLALPVTCLDPWCHAGPMPMRMDATSHVVWRGVLGMRHANGPRVHLGCSQALRTRGCRSHSKGLVRRPWASQREGCAMLATCPCCGCCWPCCWGCLKPSSVLHMHVRTLRAARHGLPRRCLQDTWLVPRPCSCSCCGSLHVRPWPSSPVIREAVGSACSCPWPCGCSRPGTCASCGLRPGQGS